MESTSRAYYEKNLGAGMFIAPEVEHGFMGYTEPLRRFIQPEGYTPQVNEIENQMPSWMPGGDYLVNFRKGYPYTKVDEGYARLPGDGYTALHPELEGINPEDYPDIAKLRILSDVAPYSREYQRFASIVRHQSQDDPDLKVEYERISEQVRQTKESTLHVARRHFNAPVDTLEGTVKQASAEGVELNEYPGRTFRFSSVGSSMADLSAEMLGKSNTITKAAAVHEVEYRRDLDTMTDRAKTPGPSPLSAPGADFLIRSRAFQARSGNARIISSIRTIPGSHSPARPGPVPGCAPWLDP